MIPPQRRRGVPMTPLRQKKKRASGHIYEQRHGLKPVLLRLKPEDKALIEKAAELSHQSQAAFMEHHALEAARRVIKENEGLK